MRAMILICLLAGVAHARDRQLMPPSLTDSRPLPSNSEELNKKLWISVGTVSGAVLLSVIIAIAVTSPRTETNPLPAGYADWGTIDVGRR